MAAHVLFVVLHSWIAGEMLPHGEKIVGVANLSQICSEAEMFWRRIFQQELGRLIGSWWDCSPALFNASPSSKAS